MGVLQPTFRDLIAENKRNSVLLVLIFCLFVVAIILAISLGLTAWLAPNFVAQLDWTEGLLVGGGAALFAFLLAMFGYYQGDQFILSVSGAREIQHRDDPELFNVVEEMAIAAGIPMPKVYVINDPAPNAFATGRDPKHAAVTVTTGLRQMMNRDELQGVIAHEMSHIRNYDIRLMMLMAVLVGTVVMLSDFFWQIISNTRGGSGSGSSSKDDGKGGAILVIALVVVAILLSIIAPILAQLIQLAVSRQREYLADASGVELTRNPLGLASALGKIDHDQHTLASANRGTAHLFIANPIKKFEDRANSIWASHPPIGDRIQRLEALVH